MAEPRFPEYGEGGDQVGSHRARHAFRFFVSFTVALAGLLWFCEYFLRHDSAERLYLSALTLPFPSARPLLQSAVKQDQENREYPTPKYLQALAEREEGAMALDAFKAAYAVDRDNAFLAIRYGCRLLQEGQPDIAVERFREAADIGADNALPVYLEAAALPWLEPGEHDLRNSLALIAIANSSGRVVIMPRPLWSGDLPQRGPWYGYLRRRLVRECCEPILAYTDFVQKRAEHDIEEGRLQYWDSWLEKVQGMGARITEGAGPSEATPGYFAGTQQASAGIAIELAALQLRERIQKQEMGSADESLIERRLNLQTAAKRIAEFENARDETIERSKAAYRTPLYLAMSTLAALFLCYLFAYVVFKLFRTSKRYWTLPHSPAGKTVVTGSAILFLVLLLTILGLHLGHTATGVVAGLEIVWWTFLTGMVLFGLVYPGLLLPTAAAVIRDRTPSEHPEEFLRFAQKHRRMAYIATLRRYYGMAFGFFLAAVSIWIIAHRVSTGLYPWQIDLLATGLSNEELRLVVQVVRTLR